MTDALLRALLATDEIARDPADWRRHANRPHDYAPRSSIRPETRSRDVAARHLP